MKNKICVILLIVFSLHAFCQDGQKAARIHAYESRLEDTVLDRVSDWFFTLGRSKQEKERILRERRAERIEQRLSQEQVKEKKEIEGKGKILDKKNELAQETEEKKIIDDTVKPVSHVNEISASTEIRENDERFFKQHHFGLSREEFRKKMFRAHHKGLETEDFEALCDKYKDMTCEEYDALYQKFHPYQGDYHPLTEEEYNLMFKQHHGGLSYEELKEKMEKEFEPESNEQELP